MKKNENKFAIDFLTNKENLYLKDSEKFMYSDKTEFKPFNLALYHIEEVTFDEKAPRKEALENVLSTMKIDGINFIYLIIGDKDGVHFYYGLSKDLSSDLNLELNIHDIGKYILEPSIKGNFRGSKIFEETPEEKTQIVNIIDNMKYYSMLEGVPGSTKDNEKFQGVDRLVDTMLGDSFGFMIVAKPLNYDDIKVIEDNLHDLYSRVSIFAKESRQNGETKTYGASKSETVGTSDTTGENYSKSNQESNNVTDGTNNSTSDGSNKSTSLGSSTNVTNSSNSSSTSTSTANGTNNGGSVGTNNSKTRGENHSESKTTGGSISKGNSTSETKNKSVTEGKNSGETVSNSVTLEYIDKKSQDWIKYLDDIIIPRLDYGRGKGIFVTTSFLFSDNIASLKKLENTMISLYSGEEGNKVPLRAKKLDKENKRLKLLKNFQVPFGHCSDEFKSNEIISRFALSQYVGINKNFLTGNWITTKELGMIAGIPQKEVVGLGLKEEIEFGLNFRNNILPENKIKLGKLVQSGNTIDNIDVSIDKSNLDKHVFVTGVTGSGKTTTCQKILIDSNLPFLIIEPAKTEYRILTQKYDDLLIFTLGKDSLAPFRLNPFEFYKHESITSRVDMIKASIEASFDMEAAIPQIIETAMYECYEDYGWDIGSNRNYKITNPFDDGVYSFPTFGDLILKIDDVVKKQGFDERLKNDYIGSIKARLQSLMVGSKGLMLNTNRSIDFKDLLNRRVVLELEEIRSAGEKSLIIGFILTNLMEAIKSNYLQRGTYSHITLVEEAHRLLSKYMPGDAPNKKQGIETFTDMLAEIRKYGESLIIVDQIPNKLTPEILKNTSTKIVHKIFAQDDKEAIGNTIVLNKEQKEFLSNLDVGRAIVFTQGFTKAIQVQIDNVTDTNSQMKIDENKLKNIVYNYYSDFYKSAAIFGIQLFEKNPSCEEIEKVIELSRDKRVIKLALHILNFEKKEKEKEDLLKEYIDNFGLEFISKYMSLCIYSRLKVGEGKYKALDREVHKTMHELINKWLKDEISQVDKRNYKNKLGGFYNGTF